MFRKVLSLSVMSALVSMSPIQSFADVKVNGYVNIEQGGGIAFPDGILNSAKGITGPIGPQGVAGPQGDTGQQGPKGDIGLQGIKGDTGPQGPIGPQGSSGLKNKGNWSDSSLYNVDDVVQSNGSSYVAIAINMNKLPPNLAFWTVLAAQGPQGNTGLQGNQGLTGETGATGVQGPQGVQGVKGDTGLQGIQGLKGDSGAIGPQGLQGLKGDTGLQGIQGSKGDTGAIGPQGLQGVQGIQGVKGDIGAQGPIGPKGLNWRGSWQTGSLYALNDAVFSSGSSYMSLADSNVGNQPDASPEQWSLLSKQGNTGPQGIQGVAGSQGVAGPQGDTGLQGLQGLKGDTGLQGVKGDTGATGPQGLQGQQGLQGVKGDTGLQGPIGPSGLLWKGSWQIGTSYSLHDAVFSGGSSYISTLDNNLGNQPDVSPEQWSLLSKQGIAGLQGPQGITGPQGIEGPKGDTGLQGIQGLKGDTGATGSQGTAGTMSAVYYNTSPTIVGAISASCVNGAKALGGGVECVNGSIKYSKPVVDGSGMVIGWGGWCDGPGNTVYVLCDRPQMP
jgi:hypothetical protein